MVSITPQQTEQKLRAFANMPDSQIRHIARIDAAKDYQDSKSRKFGNFALKSVPVVDSIAAGALAGTVFTKSEAGKVLISKTTKTLSQKLGAGAQRAGFWAGAIALISVLNSINNKIKDKSPKYEKYRNNHRALNFFTDIAIFLGAWVGANKGIQALKKVANKNKFVRLASLKSKIIPKFIDKSKVAKLNTEKVAPFFKKMAEKFPKATKKGTLALSAAAFIGIGVGFLSKIIAGAKYNKHQNETYANLKKAQFNTAVSLLNKTENIF